MSSILPLCELNQELRLIISSHFLSCVLPLYYQNRNHPNSNKNPISSQEEGWNHQEKCQNNSASYLKDIK